MKPKILSLLLIAGIIALVAGVVGLRSSDDEGLFIPVKEGTSDAEIDIKDGEFVLRQKAERLKLTRAVFGYDSTDKTIYWLELDFTKWADPGNYYLFRIDGKDYGGFTVSGEREGGGRWGMRFIDPAEGRSLLKKIGKAYDLPESAVIDQTKGEQGSAR